MARARPRSRKIAPIASPSKDLFGHVCCALVGVTASTEHDRLQPSPAAKASISADGLVILDMSGGLVLSSNDVGARIWELLEQRHARGEIARRLANEYEIPIDRAQRDVAAFVAALIARGLVTPETRP
jgi:hypothetical protein